MRYTRVSALSWAGSSPGGMCVNTGKCGRIYIKVLTLSPQELGQGEKGEIIKFFSSCNNVI